MFKVIIAGGRDFKDYQMLRTRCMNLLNRFQPEDVEVFCGKATGADALGEQFAKEMGMNIRYYPADWKTFGKAAGPIRNEEMATSADALIAFWDGKSRGTKSMIDLAHRYGLNVRVIRY